ncbi:hypothetical protein KQH51_02975 [bacterium]|nr:hypothetical protein [bacterium]MCB2201886.1 hypothetical protein [bacterium]
MQEVLSMGVVFFAFAYIIKILADARTRNKLIEKGLVDKNVQHLFAPDKELQTLSSLKWGMVLVGIGLAWLLRELFPYDISGEGAVGLMFIFGGAAFLIYYPLASSYLRRMDARQRAEQSAQ